MKYFLLFFSLFMLSCSGLPKASFNCSISLQRMNVIYTTVDNPLQVFSNVPASDIECSIDNDAVLKPMGGNYYQIYAAKEGEYIFTITQKSTGLEVSHTLRAKKLPVPVAQIGQVSGDSVFALQLAAAQRLELTYIPAFDINISAEVIEFSILKISKDNVRSEVNNQAAGFSEEARRIIAGSGSGDILIFRNIKARGADPGVMDVRDLLLYVK